MCADQAPGRKDWRELARRAADETDPQKLLEIIQELCRTLDERETEKKPKANSSG